jgi:DNA-binding IclR family transcriptional regulator
VLQLAQAARRRPDADTTLAVMRQLSRRTGETVVLTRLFEQTAVCIDSVEGPQALRIRVERGQVQPLHATAAARVLLANLPEETWDHYLGEPLEPFTEQTITDPQALRAQLRQIRRQGYCVSDGELESGLRAVAVPVFDKHNDRLFALSVIGPAFRLSEQHLTEFRAWLQEAAIALQEQFE